MLSEGDEVPDINPVVPRQVLGGILGPDRVHGKVAVKQFGICLAEEFLVVQEIVRQRALLGGEVAWLDVVWLVLHATHPAQAVQKVKIKRVQYLPIRPPQLTAIRKLSLPLKL